MQDGYAARQVSGFIERLVKSRRTSRAHADFEDATASVSAPCYFLASLPLNASPLNTLSGGDFAGAAAASFWVSTQKRRFTLPGSETTVKVLSNSMVSRFSSV